MTYEELRSAVQRARDLGHDWMQFVVCRSRPPSNWDRVRVWPGLHGRCIGETSPGRFLIDVHMLDVERSLTAMADKQTKKGPT